MWLITQMHLLLLLLLQVAPLHASSLAGIQ
jgi:hypothetical protein